MRRPEILSPAGNFEKLKFAILYGADAVYFAGKKFGMRIASDNFEDEELCSAINYAHSKNVRAYITVNITPRQYELSDIAKYLQFLNEIKPDALIISDLGILELAKKHTKNIEFHISTQANIQNALTCSTYYNLGAKRVVLARELSVSEISEIRKNVPYGLELEAFVHGAMCISHSGRCLLSNYFISRDANHGACAQSCRWEYNGRGLNADIYEIKRPENHLSVLENERGSFIFSSKDLCMIEHIPELVNSGIDSFKIEGRVKSAYYTAVTTNAYKTELCSYMKDPEHYMFSKDSLSELESVSHREYSTGYFFTHPLDCANVTKNGGYIKEKSFIATVEDYDSSSHRATLIQRNKSCSGQECEIISPGEKAKKYIFEDMQNEKGEPIESAPHAKMQYSVKVPFPVKKGDIIRGI